MFQEAASASDAVRAQLQCDADAIAAIGRELRRLAPRAVITCAPTGGNSFCNASYVSYSYRKQHFKRPQRPEIFDGSRVDFCSFAMRIDTGGMTTMWVLQHTGLPQSP